MWRGVENGEEEEEEKEEEEDGEGLMPASMGLCERRR